MTFAGHYQELEISLHQVEGALFLELTYEQGRTPAMVAIPAFMATLRIVQQGEQPRYKRWDAEVACEPAPMKRDPRPMACPVYALPIEPKRLPYPTDKAGGQAR